MNNITVLGRNYIKTIENGRPVKQIFERHLKKGRIDYILLGTVKLKERENFNKDTDRGDSAIT